MKYTINELANSKGVSQPVREALLHMEAVIVKANSQAEHFEREWYLRGDELEATNRQVEILSDALAESRREVAAKDEALKLALEVMHDQGDVGVDEWIAAEAAIKQALEAPVQEPVERPCHVFNVTKTGALTEWEPTKMAFALTDGKHALYTAAQPAPVQDADAQRYRWLRDSANMEQAEKAWQHVIHRRGASLDSFIDECADFTPPAAQPAVPLTDEQIDALWVLAPEDPDGNDFVPFARAIEASHGIKENT